MIRVGKYNYKTKTAPVIEGYQNVIIHTQGDLSPYTMRDSKGRIMENWWQFHKIWQQVYKQKQPISQFVKLDAAGELFCKDIRWEWKDQIHMDGDEPTDDYWEWRTAGLNHQKWVRYPNGFGHHKECKGSYYKGKLVGIVEARRQIYFKKYREIAVATAQYKKLKEMLEKGINIQIVEVDGPDYLESYPYNKTVNGSLVMNEKRLRALIENTNHAFGHGFALAACLMEVDLTN